MSRQQHVNVEFDPQVRHFHQAVLLHEQNHRINNEFSSAISAVSLAAAHSGNEAVKMALRAVNELLHSYADVHRAFRCQKSTDWSTQRPIFANSASRSAVAS
jgi:two-component sensor histidine kinase